MSGQRDDTDRVAVIRRYKERLAADGYGAWADVPVAADVEMHVPGLGVLAHGNDEIRAKVLQPAEEAGLIQQLVAIRAHGPFVVCDLLITSRSQADPVPAVEIFRFGAGEVVEIWSHLSLS